MYLASAFTGLIFQRNGRHIIGISIPSKDHGPDHFIFNVSSYLGQKYQVSDWIEVSCNARSGVCFFMNQLGSGVSQEIKLCWRQLLFAPHSSYRMGRSQSLLSKQKTKGRGCVLVITYYIIFSGTIFHHN